MSDEQPAEPTTAVDPEPVPTPVPEPVPEPVPVPAEAESDDATDDADDADEPGDDEPADPLDQLRSRIDAPDDARTEAAAARAGTLAAPAGSLGRLAEVAGWFAAVQGADPPHDFARARLVIFAADHGVAAAGVSAHPAGATATLWRAVLDGGTAVNVLADIAGAGIRLVDVGVDADLPGGPDPLKVRRGSGRIDRADALSEQDTWVAFEAGVRVADEEVDAGADLLLLGDLGVANTTPAAVLIAVCLGLEPTAVTGRGSGIDDAAWMRKVVAVRDGLRRGRRHRYETLELLACSGGADLAAMTGLLLQAAARRTPVVLDGVVSAAAALVARDAVYDASAWWFASHRNDEPGHVAALESLGLEPLLDLGVRLAQGTGGLLALPLLRAAVRTLGETVTAEEIGLVAPSDAPDRRKGRP